MSRTEFKKVNKLDVEIFMSAEEAIEVLLGLEALQRLGGLNAAGGMLAALQSRERELRDSIGV